MHGQMTDSIPPVSFRIITWMSRLARYGGLVPQTIPLNPLLPGRTLFSDLTHFALLIPFLMVMTRSFSTLLWSVGGSSLPSTSSEEITITMPPHSTLESELILSSIIPHQRNILVSLSFPSPGTGKALCVDKKFGLYLLDQASRRILTPSSEEEVAAHAPGWGVDVGGEEGPIRVSLESLRHLFSFQPARGMRPGDCMMCQWILGNGVSVCMDRESLIRACEVVPPLMDQLTPFHLISSPPIPSYP